MTRRVCAIVGILAVVALSGFTTSPPADAATSDTESVTVSLAPGHETEWELRVENTHDSPAEVAFDVRNVTGKIFDGPAPASLSLEHSGDLVLSADNGADLQGEHLDFGVLEPGESVVLTARSALPLAATDEYRDVAGIVAWRFSLIVDEDTTPLPPTGAAVPAFLVICAVLAAVAGFALLSTRSRKRGLR